MHEKCVLRYLYKILFCIIYFEICLYILECMIEKNVPLCSDVCPTA